MADTVGAGSGRVADDGPTVRARLRQLGPGIMAAATGVGAGDLVATLVAGSRYGYTLLWAVLLGTVLKIALAEAVGRWHLTSGQTVLSGWRQLGSWTLIYFGAYAIIWGFVYGATAMSASALPLNALFPVLSVREWGILCGLAGFGIVWFGRYALIEKLMTALVGVMFVTVVGTAVLVVPNLTAMAGGLVPDLPPGSLVFVLGLAGGVGGTITMAAYGYWTHAKGWRSPRWLAVMRLDNTVGYVTTGVFVVAMLIVGAEMLLGQDVLSGDRGLLTLADTLEAHYGEWARIPFLVGFLAVSFSSLIGVWNGVSLLFADWWRVFRRPAPPARSAAGVEAAPADLPEPARREEAAAAAGEVATPAAPGGQADQQDYDRRAGERSTAYRSYLLWLTFPPMVLLFLDRPFQLIVAYGVLGALFMPFLALTLMLLLNSSRTPRPYRSRWASNGLLGVCVALFAVLAAIEVVNLL